MTAPTPEQIRALADGPIALTERQSAAATTLHDIRTALRTAADQLEAVHRLVKRSGRHVGMNGEYYTVPLHDLDAILAADTAPGS